MKKNKYEEGYRPIRSDSYQYKILEIPCEPDVIIFKADQDYFSDLTNSSGHNEELLELIDRMMMCLKRLVMLNLTVKQNQVFNLVMVQGMGQSDAAKLLGIHQSSIAKCINGNSIMYRKKRPKDNNLNKPNDGGLIKRLNQLMENDLEASFLLHRIKEIKSEG